MDSGEGADEVGDVGEVVLKPAAEERGDLTSRAASPVPTAAAAAPSLAADTIKRPRFWSNRDPSSLPFWFRPDWGRKHDHEKEDEKEKKDEEEFPYSSGLKFPRFEENDKLVLPPFEKNIDIWRQLWRVLERSDLLIMVVDARDPLFYRCPDLEAYAKEIDEHKRTMLLVNKADLLPLNIRKRWADYFKAHDDILYVFWSAEAASDTLEGKKLSGYSEEESASLDSDTKIYGRYELLIRLQAEAESIVAQRRISTTEEDHDVSSSDSVSSVTKDVVVGFVGYPNVGKSSTINALGTEMSGLTRTVGKIKLTICDVPGIILPCFTISRNDWSLDEETNVDQLAVSNLCKKVADGLTILQGSRDHARKHNWICKLKILADDIRVWMRSSDAINTQILNEIYMKIGMEIVQFFKEKAEAPERLKRMICDLKSLTKKLESRRKLHRNMNGQLVEVLDCHRLTHMIHEIQAIIAELKFIFNCIGQCDYGCVLSDQVWELDAMIVDYRIDVFHILKRAMQRFKAAPVSLHGVSFCPPDLEDVRKMIAEIQSDPIISSCEVVATGPCSDAAVQFFEIVSSVRDHSAIKFVRETHPLFKGVENLIPDELNPKCIYCFEKDGYYFTTCCCMVLCRSCAQKKTSLLCEQVHEQGVNLHFPIIVKRPVLH